MTPYDHLQVAAGNLQYLAQDGFGTGGAEDGINTATEGASDLLRNVSAGIFTLGILGLLAVQFFSNDGLIGAIKKYGAKMVIVILFVSTAGVIGIVEQIKLA